MAQKTFEELKAIFLSSPYFTDGERIAAIPYGDPAYDMFAMEELENAYYRPLGFTKNLRFVLDNSVITFYVQEDGKHQYSVENNDVRLRQKIVRMEQRKIELSQAARSRSTRNAAQNEQSVDRDDNFGTDWTSELDGDEFDQEEDRRWEKTGNLPGDGTLEEEIVEFDQEVTAHLERKGNIVVVSFTNAKTGNPVAAGTFDIHFKKEEWNYENWNNRFDAAFLSSLVDSARSLVDQTKIEREMGLLDHNLKMIVPFESISGDDPVEIKSGESGEFRGPRDITGDDRATIIGDEIDPRTHPMPPHAEEKPSEGDELPEELSTAAAGDVVNAFRTNEQFKQQLGMGGLPELPTSDADVERFKQEMQQRGLLFGDGTIQGIPESPEDAPIVLDVGGVAGREDRPNLPSEKLSEVSRVQAKAAVSTTDPVVNPPKKVKPGSQPAVMLDGIAADIEPHIGKGKNTGLADRPLPEPVPFYSKCSSDKVVSGKNNTWIVFGRDRPGGLGSGYGPGGGHTQAGSIDICVGRMSPRPISFDKQGRKVEIGPIFTPQKYTYDDGETLTVMDAARIYISQKTDLDENFDLKLPPKTKPARAVAGIAMKADGVRIMSRKHGIRLVTEDAKSISSKGGEDSGEPMGICLIAANKALELQPLIKGDNLTHLLKEMLDNQAQVAGAVASLKQDLIKLNSALLQHEHVSATSGPTVKLPSLMIENTRNIIKLVSVDTPSAFALQQNPDVMEKKYLEDGSKTAIKSKYNKVN